MKYTVDLADLAGLYFVLNGIPGKGHSKVLTAGIGWATAEVHYNNLWIGNEDLISSFFRLFFLEHYYCGLEQEVQNLIGCIFKNALSQIYF